MQSYGTGQVDERSIQGMLEDGDLFDFRPAAIIVQFQLLNLEDWNYEETASYGHFGHKRFPWEKTDKAEGLKQVFNKVKAA